MFYRQCCMEKPAGGSKGGNYAFQISWIPEKFAVEGKFLELKNDSGEWSDGWQVVQVGARKSDKEANDRSQDYKRTRRASDI